MYSRGSLCDMTRIANSDSKAWASIFSDNKDNIVEYIDKYLLELNKLKSIISSNNDDDLVSYLTKSKPKK
jgi:prephenate dehydrogenase